MHASALTIANYAVQLAGAVVAIVSGHGRGDGSIDEVAVAGRYSFQRRDNQFELGGGKIGTSKGFLASDLNSIITESRNVRGNFISHDRKVVAVREPIIPINGRNRVGHWDMYELATKIKD